MSSIIVSLSQYKYTLNQCNLLYEYLKEHYNGNQYINIDHIKDFDINVYNNKYGIRLNINPSEVDVKNKLYRISIFLIGSKDIDINYKDKYKTVNDIIDFIDNTIINNKPIDIQCKDIYNLLKRNITNKNYIIIKNNYIISIKDRYTNNGFYIFFDGIHYANIGLIKKDKYHSTNAEIHINYNSLYESLVDMMKTDVHNNEYYLKITV